MAMKRADVPAIFLDKDGTLLEDEPYNVDPARMRLMRGVAAGLYRLSGLGFRLIVITNQPGVALGRFREEALNAVERRLGEMFAASSAVLSGFYYCPHHPRASVPGYRFSCTCRKPGPGMLELAAVEHGLSLRDSWFVGDILDDVEAGRRAGCRTILLDNGHEALWELTALRRPDYMAPDLDRAAGIIAAVLAARDVNRSGPMPVMDAARHRATPVVPRCSLQVLLPKHLPRGTSPLPARD